MKTNKLIDTFTDLLDGYSLVLSHNELARFSELNIYGHLNKIDCHGQTFFTLNDTYFIDRDSMKDDISFICELIKGFYGVGKAINYIVNVIKPIKKDNPDTDFY